MRPLLSCLLLSLAPALPASAAVSVVADIAPVQSLVARVMAGAGEPSLLIPPGASPHDVALRPSDARALQAAEVVFWVGPALQPWLAKPIAALSGKAAVVQLLDSAGTIRLPPREGDGFEPHAHGDGHGAAEEADGGAEGTAAEGHTHGAAAHAPQGGGGDAGSRDAAPPAGDAGRHSENEPAPGRPAAGGAGDAHESEGERGHADEAQAHEDHPEAADHAPHGEVDPHAWLDPRNAAAWMDEIARTLAAADPANAALYAANAAAGRAEMERLEGELAAELAPVRGLRFIVLHDALQYFEARFGVSAAGAISLADGAAPGPARLAAIRERVRASAVTCALREPQFDEKLIATVFEGTPVRSEVVDDLGAAQTPGPALYPALLKGIAASMLACKG